MKTVFTNGCFDIIHRGHLALLNEARRLGDRLVVGINSDRSVRAIKGKGRPVNSESDRKAVLEALGCVDEVIIFDELTPAELIHELKPDVLVKGGDWAEDEIIGAESVKSAGGDVVTIPLVEGASTTLILEKIGGVSVQVNAEKVKDKTNADVAVRSLREHIDVFELILQDCPGSIESASELINERLAAGNKILLCGNGGSAADAQHIAAEFVGRYESERRALPAIALTTDTSALTALSNDYGYETVFARQVEALGCEGDVLIAISTSGSSKSVINAMMKAREKGCHIIGLTGSKGTKFAALCDACVVIPSERTARIQEGHIAVGHIWCELVDLTLGKDGS